MIILIERVNFCNILYTTVRVLTVYIVHTVQYINIEANDFL